MRNNYLDARNYFAVQKDSAHLRDFGYNVGGPVFRDKLFFFVGEEWAPPASAGSLTALPFRTQLNCAGNFWSSDAPLYYPGTKNSIPNNDISSMISADAKLLPMSTRRWRDWASRYADHSHRK